MQFVSFDKDWTTEYIQHVEKVEQSWPDFHLPRAENKVFVLGGDGIEMATLNAERIEILKYIDTLWEKEAQKAKEIVNCESGWKTDVISRTGDIGLFQINLSAHWSQLVGDSRAEKIKNLQNWEYNVWFAHNLWEKQGWVPWSCSRLKHY